MSGFKNTKFTTAEEKEKILALWIRFLKNNFQRNDFTKALYAHLMNNCDFIAHYSIHGFFAEYFTTGEDKIRFLKQFDRAESKRNQWISFKLSGDCADINGAMMDEAAKYLPVLYAGARDEQKQLDLRIVESLLERNGLTLNDAVKPVKPPTASAAVTQTTHFNF